MEHRELGKTGWRVSAIGLGAWGLGGQWGPVGEPAALNTLYAALDAGVTFFDTADAYGNPPGVTEEYFGTAFRGRRDKVFIATKVGNYAARLGHGLTYSHPLHVHLCCDASLHRLKCDYIDLYQCHHGEKKDYSVFLEAFERLVEQGKIRAYGLSTNSADALRLFNANGRCAAVQTDYSLLNRAAEAALLPYCREQNIGVIVRGPLAKGLCTGKFSAETRFTDEVRERWNSGPQREEFLQKLAQVEKLRFLERPGRTLAQAALQFVLAHPAVTTAIPGAKSPEQARANAGAGEGRLTEEELEAVGR